MANSFTNIASFYADLIVDFMLSDPIKYFVGALLLLMIIKIVKSLSNI